MAYTSLTANEPSAANAETDVETPVRTYRIALAILLSPWAAPGLIIAATTMYARRWPFNFDAAYVAGIGVLPAYAGMVLVGLPLFQSLRKSHRLDLARLMAHGALGGSLFLLIGVSAFSRILGSASISIREIVLDIVWGALLGSAVAAAFAFIAGVPLWIRARSGGSSAPC